MVLRASCRRVLCSTEALSAQFVLSDADSIGSFLLSHALTHPVFLASFLFYIIASDTGPVTCLQTTHTSLFCGGKGHQLGAFRVCCGMLV